MRVLFSHLPRYATGAFLLFALNTPVANAQDYATSANPLAFGPSQTIIDLNKVEWAPLELEGFGPGLEAVVLRGDLAHGSELILRTPVRSLGCILSCSGAAKMETPAKEEICESCSVTYRATLPEPSCCLR